MFGGFGDDFGATVDPQADELVNQLYFNSYAAMGDGQPGGTGGTKSLLDELYFTSYAAGSTAGAANPGAAGGAVGGAAAGGDQAQ